MQHPDKGNSISNPLHFQKSTENLEKGRLLAYQANMTAQSTFAEMKIDLTLLKIGIFKMVAADDIAQQQTCVTYH